MLFQFMESDGETDRIMPLCACEAQEERDAGFQLTVIAGELEEGIAEVILFKVTVSSPGSIGVGKMAHVIRGIFPVVSARTGMGVDSGAVAGKGKVFRWDNAAFDGREDGSMVKEELQPLLKIKRDVFAVHEAAGNGLCNFGPGFLCFLFFALRLIRLSAVP